MKNMRCFIVLLSIIITQALYAQDALYVYRNDGQFNAFFYSEIDSIRYSNIDCDSIEQQDVVVQEIWTQDSIYRIPVAIIDSVSFVKPQTKYQPNVVHVDDRYVPYITSVDGMTIEFSQDLPNVLKPKTNDILLHEAFDDLFPEGFVGQVKSFDGGVALCDSVGLFDVYEELTCLGDYVLTEGTGNTRHRLIPRKIAGEIPFSINVPISHDFGNASLQGELSFGFRIRLVTRIQRNSPIYIELQLKDEEIANWKASISGRIGHPGGIQTGERFFRLQAPIPNMPAFRIELAAAPFNQAQLSGEFSVGQEFSSRGQTSIIYDNGWRYVQTPRVNTVNPVDIKGKIDGSFWTGIVTYADITTVGNFIAVGVELLSGPKIKGEVDLNFTDASSTDNFNYYELLKDSKLDFSLRAQADLGFEFRLGRHVYGQPLFNLIPGIELSLFERYLFPLFTTPTTKLSTNRVDVSTEVSRNLLLPCTVGFRLLRDDETIATHYRNELYWYDDSFNAPLNTTFNGLTKGRYKVFPMIQLLGREIEATPETNFYYGIEVVTGMAEASYTDAECKGYVRQYDDDGQAVQIIPDEYGFFYNTIGKPNEKNAIKITCQPDENGLFNGKLESLEDNSTYYYTAFARVGEDYFYGESKSFVTKKFPVKITSFEVTNALHEDDGYTFNNNHYDYKFECTTTVALDDDAKNVEDWGYVYIDLNGNSSFISLKEHGSPYSDPWYVYYRNEKKSYATLSGFVKYYDSQKTYTDTPKNYDLIFSTEGCDDDQHPHRVDMGLPSGTRWYCTNFGADKPEGWGGYFAFAELNEKKSYALQNYLYYNYDYQFGGQYSYFENIGGNLQNFGISISGKRGYDVVTQNWGDDGRMPTKEEARELVEECTWTWSFRNEVPGYEVTGPNGNSIFLPASGQKSQTTSYQGDPNKLTVYRTGEWSPKQWANQGFGYTWGIRFKQDSYELSDACAKAFGCVIRPVKGKE